MSVRGEIGALLHSLYAARLQADLGAVMALFSAEAKFEISGASDANPISVIAVGVDEIRPWLSVMIKTFRLTDYLVLATLIDGENAVVHWRAKVHSNITGKTVLTEFVDLIETNARRIKSYTEFFVPR